MDRCRLCKGSLTQAFETEILGRLKVRYFRCDRCDSLQSENPYWLDEAYEVAIAASDTGAVARNLICHAAITSVRKILGVKGRFLDYGGGGGMLCRLLRDSGMDAYLFDRYSAPLYAGGFVLDPGSIEPGSLGLLSAIEVFEHCVNPATDLGELFAMRPQVLFATTIPYSGEGEDWWYIGRQTGQHVFFYSRKSLQYLGDVHRYHYYSVGMFHVFSRDPLTALQRALLRIALSRVGLRAMRVCLAATTGGHYSERDFQMLTRKAGR